jgi:hypothetical protein
MPSRAVEAALLAAVGIAATALAFTLLKPYLFPQRAIKLEMIRDNVELLAAILDRRGGRFTPQATYLVQAEGARFHAEIRVKDPSGEVIWNVGFTLPLPTANVTLDEKRSPFILRGSISPYANATAPTMAFVDGAKVEVILRPALRVEDCEYFGLKCKRVSVTIPVLRLEASGKPASKCAWAEGRAVDVYLNGSTILPPELKYGKELLISMKILDLDNNVKEILGYSLERELQLDLQENGVFLIQYIFDNIVARC